MRIKFPTLPGPFTKIIKVVTAVIALVGVGILIAAGAIFVITTKPELVGLTKKADNQAQADKFLAEVGSLMSLPEDERPTIATVSDVEKLKDQTFFQKAENGDQVLIYTKSRKVILYRPSQKKIIDVGSVNIKNQNGELGSPTSSESPSPAVSPFTLAIYNGTQVTGITNIYDDKVLKLFPEAKVTFKQSAAKTDYPTSYLVDIKGGQDQLLQRLSTQLKLPIQTLPEGETKPATDVLIVLGADATTN